MLCSGRGIAKSFVKHRAFHSSPLAPTCCADQPGPSEPALPSLHSHAPTISWSSITYTHVETNLIAPYRYTPPYSTYYSKASCSLFMAHGKPNDSRTQLFTYEQALHLVIRVKRGSLYSPELATLGMSVSFFVLRTTVIIVATNIRKPCHTQEAHFSIAFNSGQQDMC